MSEDINHTKTTIQEIGDLPEPLKTVIQEAVSGRATDVHLDPGPAGILIRFRVDGILHIKSIATGTESERLINQAKVAADLNSNRVFRPVESEIVLHGGEVRRNLRVSIAPVGRHEAAHLRFLEADQGSLTVDHLGLGSEHQKEINTLIERGHGLALIVGGTGTGKTTTLYAIANALDVHKNVVVSIEDPVEFRFPTLRQLEVDERHGLDMQRGLRTLLRMDPDVILVGEIRDRSSATTAARAALAGRLVLATVHARDAAMAIDALRHYAVPRYVLSGALHLIITQELLRRVCQACARKRALKRPEQDLFSLHGITAPETVVETVGCPACGDYGYAGRIGIFDVTPTTLALAEEINRGASQASFRTLVHSEKRETLATHALQKAAIGVVSMKEAARLCFTRVLPAEPEPPGRLR